MNIYAAILEEAGDDPRQAGDLHENLWNRLLRREDPRHHNVRVTRGDRGIDGIVLTDPFLGHVTIFQAKFFKDLSSSAHREAVVDALARALTFPADVIEWTLLLPINPSADEVAWVVKDLRCVVLERGGLRADLKLSINYRTGEHLEDLCLRYISDAAELLPNSALALSRDLEAAVGKNQAIERDLLDRLKLLNDEAVRDRQIQSKRAVTSLKILHQGWANHTGMLDLLQRDPGATAQKIEKCAAELEEFSLARTREAFDAEPIAPGISELVSKIYVLSRQLRAAAVIAQLPTVDRQVEIRGLRADLMEVLAPCRLLQANLGRSMFDFQ